MAFFDTPRSRRLAADAEAMKALREQSSIMDFQAHGEPPERYLVTFRGRGLARKSEVDPVETADVHRVEIRLGIDYPRSRPDLQWLTSIYHPNISGVGSVCLGGYSTNWAPSLGLAELVEMLWDMARMQNYDPKSAYNYAAGRWCETQTMYDLPIDKRSLRDRVGRTVGANVIKLDINAPAKAPAPRPMDPAPTPVAPPPKPAEDIFIIDDASPEPPPSRPEPFRTPSPRPPRPQDDDVLIIE
ncbi:MAG TPA: ubiquitin-conjugating enzyme E2 [Planctomycetota bacterium]|nr:ubiquitin-conjugating enzyme E2 [Planctomycetota bacterium]